MSDSKARSRYFGHKARTMAKQLVPPKPKPTPAPPFRPITGQGPQRLPPIHKARLIKVKPRYWKKRDRKTFLMYLRSREARQWREAAGELEIPLSALIRIAMRMLLSSNRRIRQITSGKPHDYIVKRVSKRTLERRVLKSFGVPYKETTDYVQPKRKTQNPESRENIADRSQYTRSDPPSVDVAQPDRIDRHVDRTDRSGDGAPTSPPRRRLMIGGVNGKS